jgi:hypothetical protein
MPTKQTLVVTKDDINISTQSTASVIYGDVSDVTSKFSASATAKTTGSTVPGTFAFSVNNINLSSLSTCFDVGSYDVLITFIPTDTKNYNNSNITVQNGYVVTISNVTVNLILQYSTIVYGTMCTSKMFTATAVDEAGKNVKGSFSYTINGAPFVDQVLEAGSYEIEVIFTPSSGGNYNVVKNDGGNNKNK